MADKSFGIKELNLVGSGAPKIESSGNLNLNAVTVAISTNATVGGNLDVDGHTELDDVNISGVSTFAGITTVTGQTLFTKQLGVSGITTFNSIVNFPGASYNALWNKAFNRFEFKDGASAVFGTGNDLEIKHSGGNTTLKNISGEFRIAGNDIRIQNQTSSTDFIKVNSTGSVVTGVLTATSFSGDGSSLTGVGSTADIVTNSLVVSGVSTFGNNINASGTSRFEIASMENALLDGSIEHTGDTTTQIKFPSNNNISFDTAGTTRLNVNNSGAIITGVITATSFKSSTTTGNGSDVAFATKYYITANGSSAYRFAGAGILNSTDDPTLYFHRGFTYILENSTGGSHPFELRVSDGGSAYAPGGQFLTGSTTGTQILTVPMDAPASIVYQCTIHSSMLGTINFVQ